MIKPYKAIFFDWDGTAVVSRTAPADKVLPYMISLLQKDVILAIISGTTYENIAGGRLHELIPGKAAKNLYLGLGRGAYNYGFGEDGSVRLLSSMMPGMEDKLKIHEVSFAVHRELLETYKYDTDIVFSRPNYCKIDLMPDVDRKGKLFLQEGEIDLVGSRLKEHGYVKGIKGLLELATELGEKSGIHIKATTDAKYLEAGISTKSDNVDFLMEEAVFKKGISLEECCFWGDEFTFLGDDIPGSDAFMITDKTRFAEFFDVSEKPLRLPEQVKHIGGGTEGFLNFLKAQVGLNCNCVHSSL